MDACQAETRIKVMECGSGRWDEQDHRLDYPADIDTIDFKVTGTGHARTSASTAIAALIAARLPGSAKSRWNIG